MNIIRGERLVLDRETRCECGQLIAKVQMDGLQLKCKRCKRIVTIPFTAIEGWGIPCPPIKAPGKKTPVSKP